MLGTTIKEHRIRKGLTQEQLGDLIGAGQSTIAMYENDYLIPPTQKIMKLSSVLGVPPAKLFKCVIESSLSPVPA
jgi:transcriptional regulator with XRE-family HTH domain